MTKKKPNAISINTTFFLEVKTTSEKKARKAMNALADIIANELSNMGDLSDDIGARFLYCAFGTKDRITKFHFKE